MTAQAEGKGEAPYLEAPHSIRLLPKQAGEERQVVNSPFVPDDE